MCARLSLNAALESPDGSKSSLHRRVRSTSHRSAPHLAMAAAWISAKISAVASWGDIFEGMILFNGFAIG